MRMRMYSALAILGAVVLVVVGAFRAKRLLYCCSPNSDASTHSEPLVGQQSEASAGVHFAISPTSVFAAETDGADMHMHMHMYAVGVPVQPRKNAAVTAAPPAEAPVKTADAAAHPNKPNIALLSEPSIVPQMVEEELAEEGHRRIEWIKYYVSEGDLQS